MNPYAPYKCAGRLLMALAAISGILFAVGCGSSSPFGNPNGNGFTNSNFSGTYVLSVSGTDINGAGSFFAIVGTVTADGMGNITGGTVDINDADIGGVFTGQTVSPAKYSITSDGRGTGTLVTPKGTFGIDFVLTSNAHGLITRFDNDGTGSGTLDLQGSAAQSSLASLAFSLSGADAGENPLGTVGGFTLNSSGAVTSGVQDINDGGGSVGGLVGLNILGSSSVVLSSATFGTAELDTSFGSLGFDVWVIDSGHLKLIETDSSGLALSGDAFTQQTTFTAGQVIFTLGGSDSNGNPFAAGGFVTTDVNGTLSNGIEDYNDAGVTNTVPNFGGGCTTFVAGRCQLTLNGFSNGSLQTFVFAAYPSNGGTQLLEIDGLGITQGAAYTQTATSFAAANYGLNLSGVNTDGVGDVGEVDDIAQFNATTAASPATNMTGVIDENSILGGTVSSAPLSGTYAPDSPATGRGSITISASRTFIEGLSLEYYVVDASTVIFIEGDQDQLSVGTFELQSSGSGGAPQHQQISIMRPIFRPHAAWGRHK